MTTRRAFLLGLGLMPFAAATKAQGMSYFSAAEHAAVINNPGSITSLYATHRSRFIADLGSGFAAEIEQHIKFGFAGLVAFDLKPYGQSTKVTLPDLLAAPALDCDNYAILHWHLFDLLEPAQTTNVFVVGWHNGPIGNHAQMHCHKNPDANGNNGGYWMVDPTVGIMLCGYGYNGIAKGIPVNPIYLKSFYALCGRVGAVTDLLHSNVNMALLNGLYAPDQSLYYCVNRAKYIAPAPPEDWMTPQSSALIP
jgi:hypothetical protein